MENGGRSPTGSALQDSNWFWRVLAGLVQAHGREIVYKRKIKQESFGGLVLFIIPWGICFILTVATGWMLLWSPIATPVCVTGGGWRLLVMSLLMAVHCCSLALTPAAKHSSLTGEPTQSPVYKTALKAAVPWEQLCAWIFEAALNKGLQMLLLRRKS